MEKFDEVYNLNLKLIQHIVEDIRFGRELYLDNIKASANDLMHELDKEHNFLKVLKTMKNKDEYMYTHPINVAILAFFIGKWLNLKDSELFNLVCTGFLHDLGKAKVKNSILNKRSRLTEEEFKIVRAHTINGFSMLMNTKNFAGGVMLGILSHHERNDGSGYPFGLKGEETHVYAKIIAVADIFDAMTSDKSYNVKKTPFKVVEEIGNGSFGQLDPHICQVFLSNIIYSFQGSNVKLSNEEVGEIIFVNPHSPSRPIVRCGEKYHNLAEQKSLEITEVV